MISEAVLWGKRFSAEGLLSANRFYYVFDEVFSAYDADEFFVGGNRYSSEWVV